MIQELFRVGPVAISPFGVLLVAAFSAAFLELRRNLKRVGIDDPDAASSLVFFGGIGGVVGAKVYYATLYGDWRLLFDRSGLVWYGGFLLGTAAVLWAMRRHRLPFWPTLDAATPALALGYAVGRIGCFLVGDDYGRPTDLPWGVVFEKGLPPTNGFYLRREFGVDLPASVHDADFVAVHPTQLYETAIALVIWVIGRRLLARGLAPGRTGLAMLGLLALERFGIEILRVKDDRFFGPLTLAQLISLGIAITAVVLWPRLGGGKRPAPAGART